MSDADDVMNSKQMIMSHSTLLSHFPHLRNFRGEIETLIWVERREGGVRNRIDIANTKYKDRQGRRGSRRMNE